MQRNTHSDAIEAPLFSLLPQGLPGVGSTRGRTRLATVMTLRWLAVAGQTGAVLFVYFGLGFELPVFLCFATIAASAGLNVVLALLSRGGRLLDETEAFFQLCFDVLQLAVLIALTGGLSNPFLLFLIAPVTFVALSLRTRHVVMIAVFAIGLAALMPLVAFELPWRSGEQLALPGLFEAGHFAALCIAIAFSAWSVQRLSEDEEKMVRALDAASVVVSREQRLSALGAMAAMTAHELGTPLATIHLVSKELYRDLDEADPRREDIALLAEQAERCRDILRQLGSAREANDIVHAQMPLSALIEEAAAPHRGLGVEIEVASVPVDGTDEKPPVIRRSPEVLHAVGAFIENAVSFADNLVTAKVSWTDRKIVVTILDDGPGFSPAVLPKLGEPYVSERDEGYLVGGDMGLGFFIAKTLIERSGGRVATRNATPPLTGAIVQAVWPRSALQPLDVE